MNKVVLIIDDDLDDTEIMTEAIRSVDPSFLCIAFTYPEEALDHLADVNSSTPDYIFLDMQMPRQTGDKILKALREHEPLKNVVISLYSNSLTQTVRQTLYDRGADFAFEKPVRVAEYHSILTGIFALDRTFPKMKTGKS